MDNVVLGLSVVMILAVVARGVHRAYIRRRARQALADVMRRLDLMMDKFKKGEKP